MANNAKRARSNRKGRRKVGSETKGTAQNRPGASNASQLRDDIDKGRTGDKVPNRDPATVPLGTDDEAAGTPPEPEAVDAAREREIGIDSAAASDAADQTATNEPSVEDADANDTVAGNDDRPLWSRLLNRGVIGGTLIVLVAVIVLLLATW